MREEEVDRPDNLGLDPVDPDDVVEPDLGFTGAYQHMRRAPGPDERGDHDNAEQNDDGQRREPAVQR